jgi:hypothetical protein
MNKKISSSETILIGRWNLKSNIMVADDVSKRIEFLTANILKEITSSDDGWDTLYLDLNDMRYWELTYPDSGSHGGGAPVLQCISKQNIAEKYNKYDQS